MQSHRVINGKLYTQADLAKLSLGELVALRNRCNPSKPIKSFRDKPTGIEALWKLGEEVPVEQPNKPKRLERERGGKSQLHSDDHVITLNVTENPKRGKSAARFALYEDGMTVSDAIEAGVLRADINYDTRKGFITVKSPHRA